MRSGHAPVNRLKALFQRSHVDNEAVLHVALKQTFVRLIDLLNLDHLDVRGDCVLGAKIEHFLSLADAADRSLPQGFCARRSS